MSDKSDKPDPVRDAFKKGSIGKEYARAEKNLQSATDTVKNVQLEGLEKACKDLWKSRENIATEQGKLLLKLPIIGESTTQLIDHTMDAILKSNTPRCPLNSGLSNKKREM